MIKIYTTFQSDITKSQVYVFSQKCSILQAFSIIIYIKSFQWSYNRNSAWCQDIQEGFFSRCENYSIYLNKETWEFFFVRHINASVRRLYQCQSKNNRVPLGFDPSIARLIGHDPTPRPTCPIRKDDFFIRKHETYLKPRKNFSN